MYDERWVWSRAYSDEVQTGPTTPSFYTYLQYGMSDLKATSLLVTGTPQFGDYTPDRYADFPYFRWYGARAYYNLDFERERIRLFIPPFARDDAALWPFLEQEREALRNLPFDWPRFLQTLLKLHVDRFDISLLGSTSVVYEGLERWTDAEDAFWERFDFDGASVEQIFAGELECQKESRFRENVVPPFTICLYVLPGALRTLCAEWLGDADGVIYNRLVAGLKTKTGEENIAVWKLSRSIRASARLEELVRTRDGREVLAALGLDEDGRRFRAELDEFLRAYGHRGGAERDAWHPRWRHAPELVFQSIRPLLSLDDAESPEHHETRMRELMLSTRAECIERLKVGPFGALEAAFFEWFVGVVQDYFYYRDFERFYNDKTMSRARDLYGAIARRFIARGLLAAADDIFFIGRPEMLAADRGELTARQIAIRVRSRRHPRHRRDRSRLDHRVLDHRRRGRGNRWRGCARGHDLARVRPALHGEPHARLRAHPRRRPRHGRRHHGARDDPRARVRSGSPTPSRRSDRGHDAGCPGRVVGVHRVGGAVLSGVAGRVSGMHAAGGYGVKSRLIRMATPSRTDGGRRVSFSRSASTDFRVIS